MDNNNLNNGTVVNNNGNGPDYTLWLVLGIVQIVMICCCNCITMIFGIITVVFACQANKAYKSGLIEEYENKIKTAKIVNLVGWGLLVVNMLINFMSGAFTTIMDSIG